MVLFVVVNLWMDPRGPYNFSIAIFLVLPLD